MSPGQYRGSFARHGPTRKHRHTTVVDNAGRERPTPATRRPWPAALADVRAQPLSAFTLSRTTSARKGSTGDDSSRIYGRAVWPGDGRNSVVLELCRLFRGRGRKEGRPRTYFAG